MRERKNPHGVDAPEGGADRTEHRKPTNWGGCGSIAHVAFYPGGVALASPHRIARRKPAGAGGKRGKVAGWSAASRRRMRRALLTWGAPEGQNLYGVTLTIPGPVLKLEESRAIWAWFGLHAAKAGWGILWRLEIQQRGALHWHGVVLPPADLDPVLVGLKLTRLWRGALDSIGPRRFDPPWSGQDGSWRQALVSVPGLSAMPGADVHSCQVTAEADGGKGAWLRYLQDHATKAKQEQIGSGVGRHWGIIGRARFVRLVPLETDVLTDEQWFRFLRALQRLATPSLKREGVPFGRRLGGRNRRGGFGQSVWFSRGETVKKLVEWAREG